MYYPNYLEFYQKNVIPIGPRDRKNLITNNFSVNSDSSHWMIALDGRPINNKHYYYTWSIVIYQSNSDGYFLLRQPYYVSPSFIRFDKAYAVAAKIEEACRTDQLLSFTPKNQIV